MDDTKDTPTNVHYIPYDESPPPTPPTPAEHQAEQKALFFPESMEDIASYVRSVHSQPKPNFSRKDVVTSFQTAYEAVGGTTRLAMFAAENYSDFIKHYAKLLPSQASSALGETTDITINHKLPRTALDM